jgi:GNAT superfamily N-acetyltransferase
VAPRLYVGYSPDGSIHATRHDQAEDLLPRLVEAATDLGPIDEEVMAAGALDHVRRLLQREAPVERVWSGPVFTVPQRLGAMDGARTGVVAVLPSNAEVLRPHMAEWIEDVAEDVPMFASLKRGEAVSLCCSVRVTPRAHEAGVETDPDHRRRGHAAKAVAAWAGAVRSLGAVPLYSTSWDNHASRGLARSMGLIQIGADLHLT